ncbi:MAG: hypothetical protein JW774_00950 [Candidatus Aureabacteria bacterium]|nr:hypothetical protein [Candidatus Auribacterota bacterium]
MLNYKQAILSVLILVLSLYNLVSFGLSQHAGHGSLSSAGKKVLLLDQRYQVLRPFLAGHKTVGYQLMYDPSKKDPPLLLLMRYYLAQYSLAPHVLKTQKANPLLIIDDFDLQESSGMFPDLHNWEWVFRSKDGLNLFQKKGGAS